MFAPNVARSCQTGGLVKEGAYGLPDVLTYGSNKVRDKLETSHPLEKIETNFSSRSERMEFELLRKTQGLHAPVRLAMERRAAASVGRLPFLTSSNLQLQVLTGELDRLDVVDTLHAPEHVEGLCQPHALVEHTLGIL